MAKPNWRVTRFGHGHESTLTTNSGMEVLEFIQEFLYGGEAEVGDKFIVERVDKLSQHDVNVSGSQGVVIGDRNSQNNTFTQQTAVTHVQNVRAEHGNAYVSAGSMTVHRHQDDDGSWPPPGWPFNV